MKAFYLTKTAIVFFVVIAIAGCGPGTVDMVSNHQRQGRVSMDDYAPVKIEVMPLTEIIKSATTAKLKAYISLADRFNSQIKYPAVFRFELYNKLVYSGQPKGKRLVIWPDIDLTEVTENNSHWQDTFRAYKFELDFAFQADQRYVLQITGILPNGRRLVTDFVL